MSFAKLLIRSEWIKMERNWYSISEAARFLEVSRSTIYRWVVSHQFADHGVDRVGHKYRISKDYMTGLKNGTIKLLEPKVA